MPESLETGEYKIGGNPAEIDELEPINVVAYSGSNILDGQPAIGNGSFSVNGITSSVNYIICNNENLHLIMGVLNTDEKSQYIVTCFTVPKLAVQDFMTKDNELFDDLPRSLFLN